VYALINFIGVIAVLEFIRERQDGSGAGQGVDE
jgi:multisubunit Na+/H+ antiporter MnhF subunit